jgi:hypothetical protein
MSWFAVIAGAWIPSVWSKIENIRPADEGNAGWFAVIAHDGFSGVVPPFEDLVIDDRRGLLAFVHMTAKVERLLEGKPE